ncbi:hypothetical protein RND71_005042 [Anisodus tanguticus]|uniref:Branched-chain-amino-acid aminotransferase n=1 Tax=Anisodus tanguticus TaxID=243964 RepID=A0AAE1VV73_9SOLA|nr:hypothetical protein RND71_005042 [Anisodus tanguticus]
MDAQEKTIRHLKGVLQQKDAQLRRAGDLPVVRAELDWIRGDYLWDMNDLELTQEENKSLDNENDSLFHDVQALTQELEEQEEAQDGIPKLGEKIVEAKDLELRAIWKLNGDSSKEYPEGSEFESNQSSGFHAFVGPRNFIAPAALSTSAQPSTYGDYESTDVFDWDNLGFKLIQTDYMFMATSSQDGNFEKGKLNPYGNIELSPSAGVLNYGQGLIEGTKAYRRNDGQIFLFRPQESAIRMQIGAERMCMLSPSTQQFVDAVKLTALANKRWNGTQPLTLYVEEELHRAAQGGAGGVKAITNYAPVMKAIKRAKERGYSDVLYLDSVNNKYIEEVSASNIFLVKGKIISTPVASGTILEGITRKSIIEISHDLGYQVEERLIEAEELISADEVFCTGTALGVAPVGSITYKNKRIEYKVSPEPISDQLNSRLTAIQKGIIEDKRDWIIEIK